MLSRESCLIIISITATPFSPIPACRAPVKFNAYDFLLFPLNFPSQLKKKKRKKNLADALITSVRLLKAARFPALSLSHWRELSNLVGTALTFQSMPPWRLLICSPFLSTLTYTPSFSKYHLKIILLFTFSLSLPEPGPWPHA